MPRQLSNALREEYETLFAKAELRPQHLSDVEAIYRRIARPENRDRYKQVETSTGVPWYVVAIIHNLESSGRFTRHLHNGDPLSARTKHVPRGRPRQGEPPFSWADSAADALTLQRLDTWDDWSVGGIGFVLERYNGWGYRNKHPHVKSPYLWSFSNVYSAGKYVRDGKFDPNAVSAQSGGMVLLKHMAEQDATVRNRLNFTPAPEEDEGDAKPTPNPDEGDQEWPDDAPRFPNRYLQLGMRQDRDVTTVQKRLTAVACDPGVADGDFGETTKLAVMLFQARSADLGGEPLEIDGIVGPKTWGALFGPRSLTGSPPVFPSPAPATNLVQALLQTAADEVGVLESPPGSNRGARVEEYQRRVGSWAVGQPWCMSFVYWCFDEAAKRASVANRVPKTAGVINAWNLTQNLGGPVRAVPVREALEDLSLVKPGMAFFLRTSGAHGHTGLVVANLNGLLETIEGNTNNGGSREGIGVFRRSRRRIEQINLGFASYG